MNFKTMGRIKSSSDKSKENFVPKYIPPESLLKGEKINSEQNWIDMPETEKLKRFVTEQLKEGRDYLVWADIRDKIKQLEGVKL